MSATVGAPVAGYSDGDIEAPSRLVAPKPSSEHLYWANRLRFTVTGASSISAESLHRSDKLTLINSSALPPKLL
jgi:hypothetical protein